MVCVLDINFNVDFQDAGGRVCIIAFWSSVEQQATGNSKTIRAGCSSLVTCYY